MEAIQQANHRVVSQQIERQRAEPKGVVEILRSLSAKSPNLAADARPLSALEARGLALQANIPRRHDRNAVKIAATQPHPGWIAKRDTVLSKTGSGYMIALIGGRGVGKTQIAVEAILHNCLYSRPALYVTAMDIFLLIRRTFKTDTQCELDAIADFLRPCLLVIDELGERGETEWEDRMLVYIVDHRYRNMTDTILIANLEGEKLTEQLGPSIADRLREDGSGRMTLKWESFRGKQ